MAAFKQQLAASSIQPGSRLISCIASDSAIIAVICRDEDTSTWLRSENSKLDKHVKTIKTGNAITAVITMLILLLTLQVSVFCDSVNASPLKLPPTAAKAIEARPVTLKAEMSVIPAKAVTAAGTAHQFAAIFPTSGPKQTPNEVVDGIKTDAETRLRSVAGNGFVKIAESGDELDDIASQWECVEDRNNQLTWEVKKNDGGIRDRDNSYTWFDRIKAKIPNGVSNGGRCKGSVSCDTSSYVEQMNQQKLCGYSDWRLPTREELETLIEYDSHTAQATINRDYFPEAVPSWYWTASENPHREGYAWYVLFRNGVTLNDLKERPKHVRLVRGNPK